MRHPILLDDKGKIGRDIKQKLFNKTCLQELRKILNTPLQVSKIYMNEEDFQDIIAWTSDHT